MRRLVARALQCLLWGASLPVLLAAVDARPARAAVVVLANQSARDVELSVQHGRQPAGKVTLPPGRLIPLPVADALTVAFNTGKVDRRVPLDLNCLYYFVPAGDQVELKRVVFSRTGGVPWVRVDLSGKIPPPLVVPVKLLMDDEQPGIGNLWGPELKRRLDAASQVFGKYCRVQFRVVEVGTWESDNQLRGFRQLGEEFRREVSPGSARLAIGVTGQYRMTRPGQVPHDTREPLDTHLLLPAVQEHFTARDQLTLLVHELGHFLGAVAIANDDSVMGLRFPRSIEKLREGSLSFDPINTLLMNLLADEMRGRDVRSLGDVPRSTRKYLHAIYSQVSRDGRDEAARYATLVQESAPRRARYTAMWTDGSLHAAGGVEAWNDTASRPKLAGRYLFGEGPDLRWLLDNALSQPGRPPAAVEMIGGDVLPGRVVDIRNGIESDRLRLPLHLLVTPDAPVDWPDGPVRPTLQVPTRWVRRVVWQRTTDRYLPSTLIYRDGRRLEFRSFRPGEGGIQVLTPQGLRRVSFDELAEWHLPACDPWESYFEQLALLSPDGSSRLMQLETSAGLRVTASAERFQAAARGSKSAPGNWYHLVQPAWCLQPLWLRHEQIRLRCYFMPHEVPLSRIEPSQTKERSDLGGLWPRRIDRDAEGGPLVGGDRLYHWGLGVHALSELGFPLPSCARAFRTRLGLDALAGDGGCVAARIFLGPATGEPLYRSPLLTGSTRVLDTGPLPLPAPDDRPALLTLQVDPVAGQRPPGADPLDIRDHFDWLEPVLELDAVGLRAEIDRRAADLVPAWQDWTVAALRREVPLLKTVWDGDRDARYGAYRSLVAGHGAELSVSRTLPISPRNDRLLITISRPPGTPPSEVEVRIDGKPLSRFDVPEHRSAEPPEPIAVSLAEYRQRRVTIQLAQHSQDARSLVRWWALTLAPSPEEATGR